MGRLHTFSAGFSWSTYGFQVTNADGGGACDLVLRLGSADGLLSPYSTVPEALALESFTGTEVPVPRLVVASDDASVLGAPFLICGRVAGATPSPWRVNGQDPAETPAEGRQFAEILAGIHRLPWSGRPIARLLAAGTDNGTRGQIGRWSRLVSERALQPFPILDLAREWLESRAPEPARTVVVHGDYRVGNYLLAEGRISAILDWELVHLGDPLEDLGWAYLKMFRSGSERICGLLPEKEFEQIYTAAAGIAVDRETVRYFELLALYKIAAMNVGAIWLVERGAGDLRLATMGFGLPGILIEIRRLMEQVW